MSIRDFKERNRLTIAVMAIGVGLKPSAMANKLAGLRPWKQDEINAVLAFCRQYEPGVTYEELFGATEHLVEREAV